MVNEYFDLYYLPIDRKLQMVFVYDHYRDVAYVGLNKVGKHMLVTAPLGTWQQAIRDLRWRATAHGGRFAYDDEDSGIHIICRPDYHHPSQFTQVNISQPFSRIPAAFASVYAGRRDYADHATHHINLDKCQYNHVERYLEFAVALFRVLKLSKQPELASDSNTIIPEFTMVLQTRDEGMEYRMTVMPRRFEHVHKPCVEVICNVKDKQDRLVIHNTICLGKRNLQAVVEFNDRVIRRTGHGQLVVRDEVGNVIGPTLLVYPKLDEPLDMRWAHNVTKAMCFTFQEWEYFMEIVKLYKAWHSVYNSYWYD